MHGAADLKTCVPVHLPSSPFLPKLVCTSLLTLVITSDTTDRKHVRDVPGETDGRQGADILFHWQCLLAAKHNTKGTETKLMSGRARPQGQGADALHVAGSSG